MRSPRVVTKRGERREGEQTKESREKRGVYHEVFAEESREIGRAHV